MAGGSEENTHSGVRLQSPLPPTKFVLHGTVILTPQELAAPQNPQLCGAFPPHTLLYKLRRCFWPAHAPCSPLPTHTSLPRSLVPRAPAMVVPTVRKCPRSRFIMVYIMLIVDAAQVRNTGTSFCKSLCKNLF